MGANLLVKGLLVLGVFFLLLGGGNRGRAPILESILLSVMSFWALRETKERQLELLERHFRQEEMLHALEQLCNVARKLLPLKRQQSQGRSASRAQAEDVVNLLEKLDKVDRLPRFMVQSDDLPRVLPLLGPVSVGDECGVSARLEALEASQRKSMGEMKRMVITMTQSQGRVLPQQVPVVPMPQTATQRPELASL